METRYCPNCNTDLRGEKIWELFLEKYQNPEKADEIAAMYGANREDGYFWRTIGRYDLEADRTVQWQCPDCLHIWERK
jgi:hypothetical protein